MLVKMTEQEQILTRVITLLEKSEDITPEIVKLVDENFWNLI